MPRKIGTTQDAAMHMKSASMKDRRGPSEKNVNSRARRKPAEGQTQPGMVGRAGIHGPYSGT
jgi:hypothetical protein